MNIIRRNKFLIVPIILIFIQNKFYSQECYCGLNGYGKLEFKNDSLFEFTYSENVKSYGRYYFKGDTLILNTFNRPYEVVNMKYRKLKKNFLFSYHGFYIFYQGNYHKDNKLYLDTTTVYVDSTKYYLILDKKKWNIKDSSIFMIYSNLFNEVYAVLYRKSDGNEDTVMYSFLNNCALDCNVFFNNYKLIRKEEYLLPFDVKSTIDFYIFNNDFILTMIRCDKKKECKIYKSDEGWYEMMLPWSIYRLWYRGVNRNWDYGVYQRK
ncbi:MAG TPA: hypothetical protein PK995_06770 [Bacteroidia bacterium]|nr:hypothetical protein [Bacteroidia bacterium]